jgi:hypothetical protein
VQGSQNSQSRVDFPTRKLTENQAAIVDQIRVSGEELLDIAMTALNSGWVFADDWEAARLTASHLLAMLENPPAPTRQGEAHETHTRSKA